MNRALSLLFVCLSAIVLAGCESVPKVEYRDVYITRYILPPDELLQACPAAPPSFSIDDYLSFGDTDKEKALIDYSTGLLGTNIICNGRIDGLRVWKNQKLELQKQELEEAEKAKQQR